MAEDPVRNANIPAFAEQIRDVPAHNFQHKSKDRRQQYAAEQNIKRGIRLRRDHPIVNLHRKQNTAQRKNVYRKRRQHHVHIGANIFQHNFAQPVRLKTGQIALGANIPFRRRRAKSNGLFNFRQQGFQRAVAEQRELLHKPHPDGVIDVNAFNHGDLAVAKLDD